MVTLGAEYGPDRVVVGLPGLDQMIEALRADGREVLGPTVRDGAIVIDPITGSGDLPRGAGDTQDPGRYRLVERGDGAVFGFATSAGTWKRHLFPPRSVLWASRADGDSQTVEEAVEDLPPRALFGIHGCDLAAIAVQDRVFLGDQFEDSVYAKRRAGLLLVGVNCSDPAATCFCASMGSGPSIQGGADIVLTELDPGNAERHRFLVEADTEPGRLVVGRLAYTVPTDVDLAAAALVGEQAAGRVVRSMNTVGLPELLAASLRHPQWASVAERCLSCGNCTMACPTCFCSGATDEPNAATGNDERVRQWGSCFELGHSYIHGGAVRASKKSRYRQWMTHKLSTWWDQFGTSGCVGCGRCIAWCPVGIDITEEVRAIRASDATSGIREAS